MACAPLGALSRPHSWASERVDPQAWRRPGSETALSHLGRFPPGASGAGHHGLLPHMHSPCCDDTAAPMPNRTPTQSEKADKCDCVLISMELGFRHGHAVVEASNTHRNTTQSTAFAPPYRHPLVLRSCPSSVQVRAAKAIATSSSSQLATDSPRQWQAHR